MKRYTAELKVNYGGGETSIIEKHFDKFADALETCQKFRKNAGVNYGGAAIRENDWANEIYNCTVTGEEKFYKFW